MAPGTRRSQFWSRLHSCTAVTHRQARGELSFRSTRVGQRVRLNAACVVNPGAIALRFSHAEIGADLLGGDMLIAGVLKLAGSKIAGAVNLDPVQLAHPSDVALDARFLQSGALALLPGEPAQELDT